MPNHSTDDFSAAPLAGAASPRDPREEQHGAKKASAKKGKKHKSGHVPKMEHQTPGRVRMKFASAKGNPELLDDMARKFAGLAGVRSCEVNPITGSVVLLYDTERHDDFHDHLRRHCEEHHGSAPHAPGTELDEITNKIEEEAEFLAEHSHAAKTVVHICKSIDRHVKLATNNTVDLKIGLAGGIVALSLLEMGAFAATPVWLTLGVFSLNHFVELQQHQVLAEKMKRSADKDAKSVPAQSVPAQGVSEGPPQKCSSRSAISSRVAFACGFRPFVATRASPRRRWPGCAATARFAAPGSITPAPAWSWNMKSRSSRCSACWSAVCG